jgi:acyl-coenzyme A synthetase/AMP-(fatty) acid ligase
MQVAPAELEAHLLTHPFVSDCAVIQTHHERSGEVPKAFIVRSEMSVGKSKSSTARAICEHVEKSKASYKWLAGGVEFVDAIPKNPTGKILRRHLREKERMARKADNARL